MVTDRSQKRLPPYVSYRTFRNFIEGLQPGIPARIDRSYWGDNLSGSTGTQLVAALRFLGLVDADSLPTSRLKMLVYAKGGQRGDILKQVSTEAYSFLAEGKIDIPNATYAQLDEIMRNNYQLAGDVGRKCTKFFIGLANDAGIPLSPFILKRSKTVHSNINPRTPKKSHKGTTKVLGIPEEMEVTTERISWDKILITKFPTFDPSWPDELKMKWFDGFDQLMKRGLSVGKE